MSLLLTALLSQAPAAPAGGTARAYNLGSPGNRQLQFTDTLITSTTNLTIVSFFETPSDSLGGAGYKPIMLCSHGGFRFEPYDARLHFFFLEPNYTAVWSGISTATFSPSTKYCVAFSVKSDGTRQFYINGSAAALDTDNHPGAGNAMSLNRVWQIGYYSADYYNTRQGPFWADTTAHDLSTDMSNFLTGTVTPVDAANGCRGYFDMVDLTNGGSDSTDLTAPDGTPDNEAW